MHKSGNVGDGVRDGHQDEDAAEDVEQEQQRRDQDAQEGEADVAVQLLCYHLRENWLKRDYYVGIVFFLKKWTKPGLFFVYFRSFQTNIVTIYTTNECPSSIWCQDSNSQPSDYESPPLSTRPGLPPFMSILK